MKPITSIVSAASVDRLAGARRRAMALEPPILVIGASRSAADEFALSIAAEKGATFGITRSSVAELVARLALPALAKRGLTPTAPLSNEAVAARVADDLLKKNSLTYFAPVADMPGFPRALSRTLSELRMAGLGPDRLSGHAANTDLAALLESAMDERNKAGAVDYATMLETATAELLANPSMLADKTIVLLDIAIGSQAEAAFANAVIASAASVIATVPSGDSRTLEALNIQVGASQPKQESALARLQRYLFSTDPPPSGEQDESVVLLSAPGEGREAVEIARRLLQEAERGVPFDQMAVLLRAPQTYLGVLEHALDRAGIPAWFHRGTRRPDPAGRALLALLACADEELSARRFAEYVSLGQVPLSDASDADVWSPPAEELVEAVLPPEERAEDVPPEEEAQAATLRGETDRDVAGTLRTPWRWEDLIIEAAVIGGFDRWQRRLQGLEHEYDRRVGEASSQEPDAPRVDGLRRDREQLRTLRAFSEPILAEMAEWPELQSWGDWLDAISRLVPRVIAKPERVLRVLRELAPLAAIGPIKLREVRDVLTPRLSTLTHEPPRRRFGRVFVGTPNSARGRSFRVVFVPGLAERMFPQKIREDSLLPDTRRTAISPALSTQAVRTADERHQLTVAVGSAGERLYLSYPRIDMNESRQRVPSFYVLDVTLAVEGRIPPLQEISNRASEAGKSTLAWPAPFDATTAIDDFEHDLSTIGELLKSEGAEVRGRARYLYDLSPGLQRSLRKRWFRLRPRKWDPADGLIGDIADFAKPILATQRLGARPYSATALQKFAACPYQFMLAAIYRLAPVEIPVSIQRLDPLTRGALFHQMQAVTMRRLQRERLIPLSTDRLDDALTVLRQCVSEVAQVEKDKLKPAIERVWLDEIAGITLDLSEWLAHLTVESVDWTPEQFEYSFGLQQSDERDPASVPEPALIDGRYQLRGSIDMVERHRKTGLLRVTDHKTGRNYTKENQTIVGGGTILQPILYGLALRALRPSEDVYSSRLFYCTSVGEFKSHEVPLIGGNVRAGLEVLEIIDRAVEGGTLAAYPAADACRRCDFQPVCGRREETRTRFKDPNLFADLVELRKLP